MIKKEILHFLKSNNTTTLFKKSDNIRKKYCGNKVFIRGLVEFSNFCVRNCLYCGLRKDNKNIRRYRMKPGDILSISYKIAEKGIETIVLQSGDDFYYTRKILRNIIKSIKKRFPHIAVTLSVGERPLDDYKAFRDCGADRYLLKQETVNKRLYRFLHPGQSLAVRIKILEYLKKIGYQVGAGNIIGLQGQTPEDLAEDILFLRDFQPDMIGMGPFISQNDTPLSGQPSPSLKLVLKSLALARIVTKNAHMPATTALASLRGNKNQAMGLKAGCNVIMVDFTPWNYGKEYKIYNGKARINMRKAMDAIRHAERKPSFEKADSFKKYEE